MKFLLNTGRTIAQGSNVERKTSARYHEEAATVFMNPVDMMDLMVEEGDNIRARSDAGEVVLRVRPAPGLPRGRVFVSLGPYANHIVSPQTHGTGMPDFKATAVNIEPTGDPVLPVQELMRICGGVPYED